MAAARSAYLDGLRMLARRELSEQQVRVRLAERGHAQNEIHDAVRRLLAERALDDGRVAQAIARTQTALKHRGLIRVRRQIERAGIDRATARRAIEEVCGDLDEGALLEAALRRRLRGRTTATDAERQRLYRYLLGQGFEADQVIRALDALRAP